MKLHIGGTEPKDGWTLLNIQSFEGVDIIGSIADLSSIPSGSCEAVYASHVLEHVNQGAMVETLAGIARILAKDGKFYCSVPDLDVLSRLLIHDKLSSQEKYQVMRIMYGGQTDAYDYHYFGFTFDFFRDFLAAKAGFTKLTRVDSFGFFNDTSNYAPFGIKISLNLILEK